MASKGLTQAYQVQDLSFEALKAYLEMRRDPVTGKLKLDRDDAQAVKALTSSWEGAQQRISFHRRVPSPGSLRPESRKPKRKPAVGAGARIMPLPQAIDQGAAAEDAQAQVESDVPPAAETNELPPAAEA